MGEFRTWEEYTEKEQLEVIYSDVFKDVNGFRPRGFDMTVEELKVALDALQEQVNILIKQNEVRRADAIVKIEDIIATVQKNCGCNRENALRYLKEAEGEDWYDWEHFCYDNHLPFEYFKEVA